MKILNVCTTFDPVAGGGEAERSFQLTKYLALSGCDCRVLTIDTGLSHERINVLPPGKIIALPCLSRRFNIPKFSFVQIRTLVADTQVVHMMGHWSLLNAVVYLAAKVEKKPYVICPAGSLAIFGRSKMLKIFYNLVIGNSIIRNASKLIAITQDEALQYESYGIKRENILIIPNGIAESDFKSANTSSFRTKYRIGSNPFLLFLGRLNLIKGPDLLLKAFIRIKDKFPEHDLVFAGPDGGLLAELKQLAHQNTCGQRVHFIGYIGGNEKSDALHAASFLVVPSRHEAMSIVAIEAGICGTPALLTDQCGFDELSKIGGGWVVKAEIDALANGLNAILPNPELPKVASVKVRKYVFENFSWEFLINKYVIVFTDILKNQD